MLRGTEEFKRACRTNEPLALLMVDLDGFKTVNDTYGHEAGDLVLQKVSAVMKSSLREFDILSRMGGDEFNVLLPNTSPEDAHHLAERLRWKMANTAFTPADSFLNITISIGAAMLSNEMASIDDLLRNADAALYRAKNNGKNCLVFY